MVRLHNQFFQLFRPRLFINCVKIKNIFLDFADAYITISVFVSFMTVISLLLSHFSLWKIVLVAQQLFNSYNLGPTCILMSCCLSSYITRCTYGLCYPFILFILQRDTKTIIAIIMWPSGFRVRSSNSQNFQYEGVFIGFVRTGIKYPVGLFLLLKLQLLYSWLLFVIIPRFIWNNAEVFHSIFISVNQNFIIIKQPCQIKVFYQIVKVLNISTIFKSLFNFQREKKTTDKTYKSQIFTNLILEGIRSRHLHN